MYAKKNLMYVQLPDFQVPYIFYCKLKVGVGTPSPDEPEHKKSPEMNELEPDKQSLKIWAHNFEKQKS